MQKDMNEIIAKTEAWFIARNMQGADPKLQMLKLMEEVGELAMALAKGKPLAMVIDALGDIQVVMIGIHLQLKLNPYDTLEFAYNEIKDRTGKMIDGVFVKEDDMPA